MKCIGNSFGEIKQESQRALITEQQGPPPERRVRQKVLNGDDILHPSPGDLSLSLDGFCTNIALQRNGDEPSRHRERLLHVKRQRVGSELGKRGGAPYYACDASVEGTSIVTIRSRRRPAATLHGESTTVRECYTKR